MTDHRAAARLVLTGLVLAGLTALPAPAPAVPGSTTVTQPHAVYFGDDEHTVNTFGSPPVLFQAGGGAASVYPTTMDVPHFARITDVDVRVSDLSHENPDDIQLVLVQQGGPQVTLMANAGGSTDLTNASITFDDEAPDPLPDETQLSLWTYRPATYGTVSQLPPPAPAISGNTSLSAFDGTPAGSAWQLFAFDDNEALDTGSLGFWELSFTYTTAPYPSELTVSGLGRVTDVDVSLHGLTSTYPDDLEVMLVGPTGAQVTLMSDVGGFADPDHIELGFDDAAAADVPDSTTDDDHPLAAGTYRPTNVDDSSIGGEPDIYPAPAPATTGAASLAVFNGTDPNGAWRLFAFDEEAGDVASIDSWSLKIAWDDSALPTGSVSIAGGAAATPTAAVTLNLAATDPAPGTGVSQMRFSNDGETFTAFQPYAATAAWTLSKGDGTKTVYAQFRDQAGNVSAAVSDAVVLDTTSPAAKKVKPSKNAQDVAASAKVRIVATEALDPATVTKGNVVLKRNGVTVEGKVTYVAARHKIVLKPKKILKPGTYKVIVKTRITDQVGNRFDAKKKPGLQKLTWTFTVG